MNNDTDKALWGILYIVALAVVLMFTSVVEAAENDYPVYQVAISESDYTGLLAAMCYALTELAIERDIITKDEQVEPAYFECIKAFDENITKTYLDFS